MKRVLNFSLAVALGATALGGDTEDAFKVGAGEWSASAGFGYKENVLFSEIVPVDSSFAYVGLEGIAQRDFLAVDGEWTTMYLLDNRSYLDGGDLSDETFGLLLSEFGRFVTVDGKLTAGVQYIYFNQAFDTTFDIRDVTQVVIRAQEPRLYLEWEGFFWQFEYGASVGGSRMYFKDPEDDYETIDWELEADYVLSGESHLVFAVNGFARDYTDRVARNEEGVRMDGVVLGLDQVGFEVAIEHPVQWAGVVWESELGLDFESRRDRHFGYYDRDRLKYFLDVRASGEVWRLRADLAFSDREYESQIADDGRLRESKDWIWSIDLERDLSESWALFATFASDRSDSNEAFFSYESNSLMLGLRMR